MGLLHRHKNKHPKDDLFAAVNLWVFVVNEEVKQ